ncbi:MAG: IPT/TIG domain-containing protein [Proteobacteria bacterium]|nr:IPT/TIG domain-containing protein [Pseudomonadota bacterium]MCL2307771.1 IPT/TIG domain-containing protein [Pseudomonadota bacterium]
MLDRLRSFFLNTAAAVLLAFSLTAAANTAVEYHYDAVGNIISIQRAGIALTISSFSPTSGPVGADVVIYGSGFSAKPSDNAVFFDETQAVVLHATSASLIVKVPVGATTGPIHVDVGANTATSATDFTVTDHYGVPEIESFSPNCGTVGTLVTVKGKNFDPAPGATQAGTAGLLTNTNVLNSTELTFSVPNKAATGHIQVATPSGTANSKGIFFVPPSGSGITCAGNSLTPIAIGQSKAINIASGERAVLIFEADADDLLSFHLSGIVKNPSTASISYSLYDTTGKLWKSASITGQATTISLPLVPVSGTYVLSLSVGSNGSADLSVRLDRDPIIEVDTDPLPLETAIPGQSLRFGFFAEQGQWLGVGLSGLTITPAGGWITITVLRPDGSTLESFWSYATPAAGFAIRQLPTTGTYKIRIEPGNNATSFNLLLTEDVSATLTANAAAQTFAPTRIGQSASYTFDGTAGQNVNLHMSGNTFVGYTYFYVYGPSGAQQTSTWLYYGSGAGTSTILTLNNLPATGTYTVRVVPPNGKLGSVNVALLAEATGALTPGSAAQTVNLLTGQNASYTFEGTAGQWFGLGLSDLTITPAGGWITITVLRPDGGTLESFWSYATPAAGFAIRQLPTTGAYKILIEPGNNTASFDLLLTEDASGTLVANAAAQTFAPTRIGQSASYTFNGTAGQNVNLHMSGNTFVGYTYVYVYGPSGAQQTSTWLYYGSGAGTSTVLTLNNLPATGTYTVRVVPPSGVLGSINVALQ